MDERILRLVVLNDEQYTVVNALVDEPHTMTPTYNGHCHAVARLIDELDPEGVSPKAPPEALAKQWGTLLGPKDFEKRKSLALRMLRGTCVAWRPQPSSAMVELELRLWWHQAGEMLVATACGGAIVGLFLLYRYLLWPAVGDKTTEDMAQFIVLRLVLLLVALRVALSLGRHAVERLRSARSLGETRRELLAAQVAIGMVSPAERQRYNAKLAERLFRPIPSGR